MKQACLHGLVVFCLLNPTQVLAKAGDSGHPTRQKVGSLKVKVSFSFIGPQKPSPTMTHLQESLKKMDIDAQAKPLDTPPILSFSERPTLTMLRQQSWIGPLSKPEAEMLALDLAHFLSSADLPQFNQFNLAEVTQSDDPLTPLFISALDKAGLKNTDHVSPEVPFIRYEITPFQNRVLVQLMLNRLVITRIYAKSHSGLVAASAFTIRAPQLSEGGLP